jgi:hypothetical protein
MKEFVDLATEGTLKFEEVAGARGKDGIGPRSI